MKPTKKGNVVFANGYNRIKQTRHGYMLYNSHDVYVGQSFDAYGECCEKEVEFLLTLLPKNSVVMDIGANYGALTVPLARKASHVHAFEPQREAFYALAANLALNCLANVSCENKALASQPGLIRVPALNFSVANNVGGLSLTPAGTSTDGYYVQAMTLDDYVATSAITRLDLLKIDVEGMEEEVLRGGRASICRLRPLLYLEADRPEKIAALKAFLTELGYSWEEHNPPLFNSQNFFNNQTNVWGRNLVSANLLCRPKAAVTSPP